MIANVLVFPYSTIFDRNLGESIRWYCLLVIVPISLDASGCVLQSIYIFGFPNYLVDETGIEQYEKKVELEVDGALPNTI